MHVFDALAEQRIREAQENGEFDDLPGAGAPLDLGDDALVPEELRTAYRLLKNAGFVPPELEAHREIRVLEQLLRTIDDVSERSRLLARINFLLTRGGAGRGRGDLRIESDYFEKIAAALEPKTPLREASQINRLRYFARSAKRPTQGSASRWHTEPIPRLSEAIGRTWLR